jgi:hypothetical protein
MVGVTRGLATLVAAAGAGFLLWLATQVGAETAQEYWATYGLIAAAGLLFPLAQIAGGWTKRGRPTISPGVFLLGFLPVLAAGGWILLARQPDDFFNTSNWSRDFGIYGVVADLGNVLPAIAFAVGLTFGLIFDTTGPRREVVEPVDERATDEPLTAERDEVEETEPRRFGRRRRRVLTGAGRREE